VTAAVNAAVGAAPEVVEVRAVRMLRAARHPLRALAMTLAAVGVAWGIAVTPALVAVGIAAVLGVFVGERLGHSQLRTPVIPVAAGALFFVALAGAWAFTGIEPLTRAVGIKASIETGAVIRWGLACFAFVGGVRALAVRRPAWLIAELLFVVVALAWVFAAHRDGAIARPLWVSDWALRRGMDPARIFLVVGSSGAALLALLLLLERKGSVTLASLLALPIFALLVLVLVDYTGRPTPKTDDGLGLIDDKQGEPPNATPEGPSDGQGEKEKEKEKGGGGARGSDGGTGGGANSKDGDGGAQPEAQDGGGSGGRDGGAGEKPKPPKPPANSSLDDTAPPSEGSTPVPMAVVVFENDYEPPSESFYFRQDAWSQWNGTRLVQSELAGADEDVLGVYPTKRAAVEAPPSAGRAKVTARVALMVEHDKPFGLESPTEFEPVRNPNPDRFTRVYRVRSLAQKIEYQSLIARKPGNPAWAEPVRAMYLEGHPDERYQRLAEEITSKLPAELKDSPFAKAAAIKVWLDKELTYSTKERHAGVADPTTHFLFGNRVGYCVHFAHATVFLWRSLGIPARVGTGYMVAAENRRGGSSLMIRNNDAHAWPELYLEGVGWVVLDIAAEHVLDEASAPMDDDLQRMLGEMAREPDPMDEEQLEDKPREKGALLKGLLTALGVLAALALLGLYGTKTWRRLAPWFVRGDAGARLAYRAVLDSLADQGELRNFGETREAFAARLRAKAPTLARLTELHVEARLGEKGLAPEKRAEFASLLARARAEVRAAAPLWRRVLGHLHPYNFVRVK
jgi:transglutaminase-like putative cysteine protease